MLEKELHVCLAHNKNIYTWFLGNNMNERKTEEIVRSFLQKEGYYEDSSIVIEEQQSDNPLVKKVEKCFEKGNWYWVS